MFTNTGSGYIGYRNWFLELIPGLLKSLQIRAQATLASGTGSLESIPRLHNMKNEDEDDFFGLKRVYSPLNYQRNEE